MDPDTFPSSFDDFILSAPSIIKRITANQLDIQKEHFPIMHALSQQKYMTVKEIFDVFYDESTQKHTKTIKTIYRYMETLEKADLVKVAGHRKPLKGNITEKLYCRTAVIIVPKDKTDELEWWKTIEGEHISAYYIKYIQSYLNVPSENILALSSLVFSFFAQEHKKIQKQFDQIEHDPQLSEHLSDMPAIHIKEVLRLASYIEILRDDPNFFHSLEFLGKPEPPKKFN